MMYAAGVDVGSTQTKAVVLDEWRYVAGRALIPTGASARRAGEAAFVAACRAAGVEPTQVGAVVGTGYGRHRLALGDGQVSDLAAHARGAHALFPGTRTVVDLGAQDTKAIRVHPDGAVMAFAVNGTCASGAGRSLAATAEMLGVTLAELGPLSLRSRLPVRFGCVCPVFVASDVMSFLARRKTAEDIVGGLHEAIAARILSLVRRVGLVDEVTLTGGASRDVGLVRALEDTLGLSLNVSADGHYAGALGAALFALERAEITADTPAAMAGRD